MYDGKKPAESEIDYIVSTVYECPMDLTNVKTIYRLSSRDFYIIKKLINSVTETYPLVPDERIIRDVIGYLQEDFLAYSAGTIVFIRTTNKAKIIHFFASFRYSARGIKYIKETSQPQITYTSTPEIPAVIKDLFNGLTKGLLGMVGSWVFDQVFPSGGSEINDLLNKIQESTRNIFREELDEDTLKKKKNSIESIILFMQREYNPLKESPSSTREQLYNMLRVKDDIMWHDVMKDLVDKNYRSKGISHLVTGANTHLSIFQELAIIDPKEPDPQKSSFMTTFYLQLEDYIDRLDKAISEVYSSRKKFLGPVTESTPIWSVGRLRWTFTDHWSNQVFEFWDEPFVTQPFGYDRCVEARERYYNDVFIPKIIKDLAPYNKTKNDWIAMRKK